ncbi:MAG: hypothetical protein ACI4QM_01725 [Alphaproteobacteria bacterium]
MPQFDLTPYLSQAFWMLISFGFMYLLVSFLIFPMIEDVLSERDSLIKTNLEAAERINKSAEKLIKDYDEFMLSAEQQKASMLKDAYEQMHRTSSEIENAQDKKARAKIHQMERQLQALRDKLSEQSDDIAEQVADRLAQKFYTDMKKG